MARQLFADDVILRLPHFQHGKLAGELLLTGMPTKASLRAMLGVLELTMETLYPEDHTSIDADATGDRVFEEGAQSRKEGEGE